MNADDDVLFDGGRNLVFLSGAIVTPTSVDRANGSISGCVYDSAGRMVSSSERFGGYAGDHFRSVNPPVIDAGSLGEIHKIDCRCLYLGHYMGHYGHFIVETLSSFWALHAGLNKFDKVIFQPFIFQNHLRDFAVSSLRVFDMTPAEVIFADQPLRIAELVVPDRLFNINKNAHREMVKTHAIIRDFYDVQGDAGTGGARRFYLSRLRFNQKHQNRTIVNEGEVENLFRNSGFVVVYPEDLTFVEQLRIFSRADVIAGFSGSALHNCLFMRPGGRVIELGDVRSPNKIPSAQMICNRLSGLIPHFIDFRGQIIDKTLKQAEFDIEHIENSLARQTPFGFERDSRPWETASTL